MVVAILLVVLGGITYYVGPMSWVYQNYSLFFFVINFILIMMILGLAFISILLLPYVQLLFLKFFLLFAPRDRPLETVVRKNFESHEGRNTKTAMMFTVALAFLIFAGSTFDLIGNLVISQLEGVIGADILISSQFSPNYINEADFINYLEQQKQIDYAVTGYSFVTTQLTDIMAACQSRQRLLFGSASGYNEVQVRLYGL